jgi:nitroreductase/dihydropteridine reductase
MNLKEIAEKRYSTKVFDPNRKISTADFEQIKALLRLSPSSVNSQPWHFIVADTPEEKARIRSGTRGEAFNFNDAKLRDASHAILFCVKTGIDDAYLEHLLVQEEKDGRFSGPVFKKEDMQSGRARFTALHRYVLKDTQHWMEKQVYLNLGMVLLGAAALGFDAVPIEGIDRPALDAEFGLREKGYTALVMAALGYRADDDFNAALPKSRLPEDEIFTILK